MSCSSYKAQRGSGLVVVLFVIVVMAVMAMSLMTISGSSQTMTTKEVLGTRAWFTAHSANEAVLTSLFPLGMPLDSDKSACKTYAYKDLAADLPALSVGCVIDQVRCQAVDITISGDNTVTEYHIESTATCGSGAFSMTRTQSVWAKGVNN